MRIKIEDIKNELVQEPYLSGVKVYKDKSINGEEYPFLIKCDIEILQKYYPLKIGIPEMWAQELIDVYVDTENVLYMPHIDSENKVCLFDLEGVLIERDFAGVLKQCLERTREILGAGISGKNWQDFLMEFDAYIRCLPGVKICQGIIPDDKKTRKIYYCALNKPDRTHRKGEDFAKYLKRIEVQGYFASCTHEDFETWQYRNTKQRGMYVSIKPTENIYPPRYDKKFGLEEANNILSYIVPDKDVKRFFTKNQQEKFLLLGIEQPEGTFNAFGLLIKDGKFEVNSGITCIDAKKITPLVIERLDEKNLLSRTSCTSNSLAEKKYLLIGCGSIGGHIFFDLIKSGCKNIDLVDPDIFGPENIYRHLLGKEFLGKYKVEALKLFGHNNIPNLEVTPIANTIQDAFEDNNIDFEKYDYIVAATGNENLNRWINDYVFEHDIKVPVFYIWNEPLDIGSHVALIRKERAGCYECFFRRNKLGGLSNVFSYCQPGQDFIETMSGCGGSYIPYGSLLSVQSSLLFMELLKKDSEGRIKENMIVSEKGDDFHFLQAGFKFSERYIAQKEKKEAIGGLKFRDERCGICGVTDEYRR